MYLKRKIDDFLIEWKNTKNHKPLIIKGARQVGKTKSILNFAHNNYKNVIEINFVSNPEYKQIVENGYLPENILKDISRINPKFKFKKNETLIFFDEIQEFPDIVTSLKFFSIDASYDVICSGSLLGIQYEDISSISVGYKTEVELYSLDFEEFLWAKGYLNEVKDDILAHMMDLKPFSESVLKLYNNLYKDYLITGGMPDVVVDFITNNSFENTSNIQKQIIISYKGDIRKYAVGLDKTKILNVFESIPFQLAKENKKFQPNIVKKNSRFDDYRGCIEWLVDAGIIVKSNALQILELPLEGNLILDNIRVYYKDNGLLLSQLDEESQFDFRANKNINTYKGGLYESIVAEALVKEGYNLHFYKKENSTLEEDFLVRCKDYIVPIEVKASNGTSKSLQTLIKSDKYKEISFGIKLIDGNIGFANNIYTFPHFTVFLIKDFLKSLK